MSLEFYFHPLSSFCQKVLIALYENDTPFTPRFVDFSGEGERADFLKLWPIGKFPVLRDDAKDRTIPESSIIIEYLAQNYPGKIALMPADPDLARPVVANAKKMFKEIRLKAKVVKMATFDRTARAIRSESSKLRRCLKPPMT